MADQLNRSTLVNEPLQIPAEKARLKSQHRAGWTVQTILLAALILLTLLFNLSRAVRADYGHDEDQFITSARLLLDQRLLPYRDYPYFHTPYLVFVYAGLFSLTGSYNLLAARFFSAVCASGAVLLVFWMVLYFFRKHSTGLRWLAAIGTLFFYLPNPLLGATAGLSWNHNLSILLALASLCLVLLASEKSRPRAWLLAGGILFGLSAGTRVSAATLLPAFLLAFLWFPRESRSFHPIQSALVFCVGFGLALLPLAFLFFSAPQQFLFGNLEYARLNSSYRLNVPVRYDGPIPVEGAISLTEKFTYLWSEVIAQPSNLLVLVALAFFGWAGLAAHLGQKDNQSFERALLLAAAPFAAVGSFLPSPSWYQYFYAPLPFALLAVSFGLADLTSSLANAKKWLSLLFIMLVLLANLFLLQDYRRISFLRYVDLWKPLVIHQQGERIKAQVAPSAKILTFAPLYPLEGGLQVYPPFATGVFAYRVGSLLSAEDRQQQGIISEPDLAAYLETELPDGILVGFEPLLEKQLEEFAVQRGYQPQALQGALMLWILPKLPDN
jgi:4-amino-4-deoxy-L-arabinose transferase-like glycosyltransferase